MDLPIALEKKIMTDLKSKFKGLQNEPPYDYITDRPIPEAFVTVTEISKIVLENLTLG